MSNRKNHRRQDQRRYEKRVPNHRRNMEAFVDKVDRHHARHSGINDRIMKHRPYELPIIDGEDMPTFR